MLKRPQILLKKLPYLSGPYVSFSTQIDEKTKQRFEAIRKRFGIKLNVLTTLAIQAFCDSVEQEDSREQRRQGAKAELETPDEVKKT